MDFVLVHGAYHGGWCWERLCPELERLGHRTLAVDLPIDDPTAGAAEYAAAALEQMADRERPVVVGHSMAGLVIPLVAAKRPVRRLIFVAALLPKVGGSVTEQRAAERVDGHVPLASTEWTEVEPGLWTIGGNTARELFFHDVPRAVADRAIARLRPQAYGFMHEVTPLTVWPNVESGYVLAQDDRAVNPAWSRQVAQERLGVEPIEIAGGHSPFLSRPAELAGVLDAMVR